MIDLTKTAGQQPGSGHSYLRSSCRVTGAKAENLFPGTRPRHGHICGYVAWDGGMKAKGEDS